MVNPAHRKNVPGRQTDVKDAEWIADLLRHGLLTPSFIPDKPQRELRELTRQRTRWLAERSREVNRIQKVLEGANIKLRSVATDVLGVSARAMIEGLIAGTASPKARADLARGRLKQKHDALIPALTGQVGPHQCFWLQQLLRHIDELDAHIAATDQEVTRRVDPQQATIALPDTIPGIDRRTAEAVVAEIGTDLTRFPDANHWAAWAGAERKRRQAPEKYHPQGQSRPAGRLGVGRVGGQSHQDHVFRGTLPAVDQTAAQKQSDHRPGASDPGHHLPRHHHGPTVKNWGRPIMTSGNAPTSSPGPCDDWSAWAFV